MKARCEGHIHSKWNGSHGSTDICEDARIGAMKGVPMWFCCKTIIPRAQSGRNNVPPNEAYEFERVFFCHGATKTGHKSIFSSHMLLQVQEFIMSHLGLGLSIPHIMAKHMRHFLKVYERGEELTRDLFICEQDIHNVAGHLEIETYKRDNNDTKYVCMWVQKHLFHVFHYKELGVHVRGAITHDNIPFTICIQTSWQQDMMLKHGCKKVVFIDATFATNENKICCYHSP